MCLAQYHNTETPVRLEPAASLSQVKHSTTEPLHSLGLSLNVKITYSYYNYYIIFIPPANFVCRGYTVFTLSVRPCVRVSVRASVRPSVTFCFLNNSKSHCWIFIKPCKHIHICKTNTLDKKVRARGQFYLSYFPL